MDQPTSGSSMRVSISADRYQQLYAEQNLAIAVLAGVVAAVVGAIAWAAVTVTTEYQIGYMAIAVGFIVGFAVRLGKGVDKVFGIIGAILALLGCVLGNVFSIIGFICKQQHMDLGTALSRLDYSKLPQVLSNTFSVMDLVFYGIAVYEGYRFSFRRLTPQDLGVDQIPAK
jgi:uncharacterized membrane protein